jgi:RNA polymerase sigma-70 factor, ECF subfamily
MDEEAIKQIKDGDIRGLEEVVKRYQEKAVQIAFLITRDSGQAQDVVQDAFIRAYEQREHYDPDRPFAPWFFKIVSNLAVRAALRDQKSMSLDLEEESMALLDRHAEHADLETVYEKIETEADICRALSTLPPEQRAVFIMHYLVDLKETEIAAALNRPPGTIKWQLFRARERLQVLLRHWLVKG